MTYKQLNVLAAIGFVIMWSSGFIGARLGTEEASSMTILMWRFVIAGGILSVWWGWRQRKKISFKNIVSQSLIGLFAQGGYLYCVFLSVEYGVSAGISNLITTLQPIVAAALAGPILKETTTLKQWGGLAVGILGVLFVVYADLGVTGQVPVWAYALSFIAMLSLVGATLYEKVLHSTIELVDALPIQTIISAFLFTLIGISTDNAIPPATGGFWLAVMWLALFSTIGGYGFYWLNLKLGSITRVSSLLYLTPPVTMIWSFLMFGDQIGSLTIIGMIVCLIGVWIIKRNSLPEAAQQ